jgi:hypothetical protein
LPPLTQRFGLNISLLALGSALAGAAWALFCGDDINFDWQNYHEYNVLALLSDRSDDVAPGGFQTFFNPLIYVPNYWLRHGLGAVAHGAITGAVHGLNLVVVYLLTRALAGGEMRSVVGAAAVIIGATGAMTLSEVGTSFADILTALPILAGLLLLLRHESFRHVALGGVLIGAAVGLKLTNAVFAFGAIAAALASARPTRALVALALGGAVGAAATGGFWSLMLWREFGNPVFPLFNGAFNSPEMAATNILDLQFLPAGLLDALAYPFYWLMGVPRTAEFPFRDARFAVVTLLLLASAALALIGRPPRWTRSEWQAWLFFLVSYAVWLTVFAIHRYAVALELLCGPLIAVSMLRLSQLLARDDRPPRWINPALVATALVIAAWSQPADWWRRPWTAKSAAVPAALQQPADYIMLSKPMSYVISRLPAQSRYFQIGDIALPIVDGGKFDRLIERAIANPLPGGLWAMRIRGHMDTVHLLETYGLDIDLGQKCLEIDNPHGDVWIEACPLRRKDARLTSSR